MACNNIEIEIQVNIENSQPLLDFLATAGTFKQEVHQVDEYFSPGHKDFLAVRPVSEWLRLREADGVFFWNYKNWHFTDQGESHHCDEFETKLDNVEAARRILQALNFTSLAVVDKLRRIWEYKNYEIALDSVRGLGDFVEIEYIGTDEKIDPAVTTAQMIDFLKSIGVGKITRNHVGYPFILLFPEEVKYEVLS